MKLVVSLLALVLSLGFSARALAQEACFPDCREGYVCNPEGQCVSACNPACEPGQRCMSGECYAKVSSALASQPAAAPIVDPLLDKRSVLSLQAGVAYQFLDNEFDEVITATGLQIAALIFPLESPMFLRPRLVIALGDENYYEPSIDLGYEFRFSGTRVQISLPVALVVGLWPNFAGIDPFTEVEPLGLYLGATIGPAIEFGKVSLGLHLEHGYQTATEPNTRMSTLGFMIGYAL